eukprot:scaffold4003_cov165-Amphora_coffeaeformis.AAC.11
MHCGLCPIRQDMVEQHIGLDNERAVLCHTCRRTKRHRRSGRGRASHLAHEVTTEYILPKLERHGQSGLPGILPKG